MPSEKKSKKHKAEQKSAAAEGALKPLDQYVDDRLELTKQLFSCLKTKQIKQRLPPNLQNKSIEKIQQICLDEILGISTKRLVSIINHTTCPDNTDSDDSEIEQVDEHVSMEEISSDSEEENSKKPEANSKKEPKTPKEMTMLELLELQARARAIRSQLALEPVTKIELDESDEEAEAQNGHASKEKPAKSSTAKATSSKSSTNEKKKSPASKAETTTKVSESKPRKIFSRKVEPSPPPAVKAPVITTKPVKLKRNYKTQGSETVSSTKTPPKKEILPAKEEPAPNTEVEDDDDDVITMHQSPETFFISDSDEEPPLKKSPVVAQKPEVENPVETKEKSPEKLAEPQTPEEGELSDRESSPEAEKLKESPIKPSSINEDNADDVIHLMSDTEIDLHHHEDEETDEAPVVAAPEIIKEKPAEIKQASTTIQVLSIEEIPAEKSEELAAEQPEKFPDPTTSASQFDEDVVEIHNSSDDEMMNESDDKSAGESGKKSQTWEERWLSSSKTQKVLKTTQLASKVRGNLLKTKKSQIANEKKRKDSEKAMKDKVSSIEEGSLEQFKVIKDNSNSSVN